MGYGIIDKVQAFEYAHAVCDVLGNGANGNAALFLVENAAAETRIGDYIDRTDYSAGTGLTQVDESTFDWLVSKYEDSAKDKLLQEYFDIKLSKVKYFELENSPLLAMVFCRLRYLPVVEEIPTTIYGRAEYWKQHYNSYDKNAKGTPEGYVQKVMECNVNNLHVQYYAVKNAKRKIG